MRELGETLPEGLFAFVLKASGWHQLGLALLSGLVFASAVLPLELQRRIINDTLQSRSVGEILRLVGIYIAIALAGGLLKLALNVYRSWVGESTVRGLRLFILDGDNDTRGERYPLHEGINVSLVIDEADPIGGFVGTSISEPVLQGGILVGVFGYMIYLQPALAIVTFLVFSPQLIFIPLMQVAINRRVNARIGTMRRISVDIVSGAHPTGDHELVERIFVLDMGIYKFKFSMNFLMNLVHHLGICAILALGGTWVIQGKTEIGTVVAFLSGLGQLNDPWGDLVNWFRDLEVTQTKYRRITQAVQHLREHDPSIGLKLMTDDDLG